MQLSKTISKLIQGLAVLSLVAPAAALANAAAEPTSDSDVVTPPEPAAELPPPPPPPPRPRRPLPRPVERVIDYSDMPTAKYMSLSGPRVGVSFLQGKSYRSLQARVDGAYPFVTMLGWQFEHAWLAGDDGTAGLIEIVPTVSGFNQGLFIPGINALFGVRSSSGLEFGAGGQISVVGGDEMFSAGALFAVGVTVHTKSLNFPIDLIWVSSQQSNRIAVVAGFSGIAK